MQLSRTVRLLLWSAAILLVLAASYALKFAYDFGAFKRLADYRVDQQRALERFGDADASLQSLLDLADADTGFQPLFDGATLNGWHGDPDFWFVKEENIVGDTRGFLTSNTFIYTDQTFGDFVLKLEFRLEGEGTPNSGVQYRSKVVDAKKFKVEGYQADMAFDQWAGALNEEGQRWMVAWAGERVWVDENGGRARVTPIAHPETLMQTLHRLDWNAYTIIAKGDRLVHSINGHVFVDVIDDDPRARKSGHLALQLHAGKRQIARFRNIRLKAL